MCITILPPLHTPYTLLHTYIHTYIYLHTYTLSQSEILSLQARLAELEQLHRSARSDLEAHQDRDTQTTRELQRMIDKQEYELKRSQERLQESNTRIEADTIRIQSLERQIQELQDSIYDKTKSLQEEKHRYDLLESTHIKLVEAREKLTADLLEERQKYGSIDELVSRQKASISALEAEVASYKARLNDTISSVSYPLLSPQRGVAPAPAYTPYTGQNYDPYSPPPSHPSTLSDMNNNSNNNNNNITLQKLQYDIDYKLKQELTDLLQHQKQELLEIKQHKILQEKEDEFKGKLKEISNESQYYKQLCYDLESRLKHTDQIQQDAAAATTAAAVNADILFQQQQLQQQQQEAYTPNLSQTLPPNAYTTPSAAVGQQVDQSMALIQTQLHALRDHLANTLNGPNASRGANTAVPVYYPYSNSFVLYPPTPITRGRVLYPPMSSMVQLPGASPSRVLPHDGAVQQLHMKVGDSVFPL